MAISTAIDASAVARVVGIKTIFKNLRGGGILFLPQRLAIVGQGSSASVYSTTKRQVTTALEAAQLYGFGSPLHLAALQVLPVNGDGVGSIPVTLYPLDDEGAAVASTGAVGVTGTATESGSFKVLVNNIESKEVVVSNGDLGTVLEDAIATAINAVLEMPVVAVGNGISNEADLTSKWKGASANDITVSVTGTIAGLTFVVTQPSGGLTNPNIDAALAQVGDVWETMMLNCLDTADTTTLDKYQTFGEGRWGSITRKPLVVFTGNTEANVSTAVTVPDARAADRVNSQLTAPGSDNLPFVVAARQLARIVTVANNNPPRDYGSQDASGIVPGTDGEQWTHTQRDLAVKAGSSTVEVKDGVVNVSDTVTFYHPAGDATPAYRYVVDIVKLQNIIFNLDLMFATAEWDGAPLIPDDQPTVNRDAKQPKTAVAAVAAMIDSLALNAIVSDPETAKANTFAEIDAGNPKRLNVSTTVQLSGNTNIISVDLNFGFYFGTSAVVA